MRTTPYKLIALLLAICPGIALAGDIPLPGHDTPWQAALGHAHPLVGRVWDTRVDAFLTPEATLRRLAGANFVLLGEIHTNPDHHVLQAAALQAIVRTGRKPALVFEMLSATHNAETRAVWQGAQRGKIALPVFGERMEWQARGWPAFALYEPIFDVARAANLEIHGGDTRLDALPTIGRGGLAALDGDADIPGLALAEAYRLDDADRETLDALLVHAHCGFLPEKMLPGMRDAQRLRDASLASALLMASPTAGSRADGAVLIAGAGHVRRDFAVPAYLAAERPSATVIALAFVEVLEGAVAPAAYLPETAAPMPVFDLVWFTAAVDSNDPCAGLAAAFDTHGRPSEAEDE